MLLIYTHKITPRFSYIMKQLFTGILGIEVSYTTKVEDFIKHKGAKITYSKQPLQNEFFVRSGELLFDQGINDLQIKVHDWEGTPCFFPAGERSSLPFDIFAASFYLLSRYEEYLPHVKDGHGRFPPNGSMAYQHTFLDVPVVDVWALKLLKRLKERFPDLSEAQKSFSHTSIIDVTTSHCYAHRGLVRSLAGILLDLASLRLKRIVERFRVWMDPSRDPYDNFFGLVALHKKYRTESMFFFQFAEYSTYDKNVSPNNNKFRHLIKSIADYSIVSLAASYSSFQDIALLKREKKELSQVLHRPIRHSRMRYNRVDIPTTYRNLVEAEFTDDFTMGYTHEIGFRAGTCTPFQFYDIPLEVAQPIKIHPFAVHDYALIKYGNEQEILPKIQLLINRTKEVNGKFISIFSNENLGEPNGTDWMGLYEKMLSGMYV
ncbi:MAG: polysaccharide deacetylase family protein [Sediminicola sp.]